MKIAVSDQHIQPFKAEKFKTQRKSFIEAFIQKTSDLSAEKRKRVYGLMERVIKEEHITVGVFNGDFMESSATERGLFTEKDLKTAIKIIANEKSRLGLERIEINMGNHESGYKLPLSSDPECGIRKQSINNFLTLVDRKKLYYSFQSDGYRIIFIPYIFSEDTARDFDLGAEKRSFLDELEKDLAQKKPVILFVHDPDSFDDSGLISLIRTHRSTIRAIFFGHYHSWINLFFAQLLVNIFSQPSLFLLKWFVISALWVITKGDAEKVSNIEEYFKKRRNIPRIIKELDAILIPAPAGMYGIGGGFFVLDTETFKIKKYS